MSNEVAINKILKLVNEQNSLYRDVSLTNITLSLPYSVNPVDDAQLDYRNTGVSLNGILNSGYKGSTNVFYRRHNLTTLFDSLTPEVRTRDVTIETILSDINTKYGLYLTVEDIANPQDIPTFLEEELEVVRPFELIVKEDRYGWIGTVTIDVLHGNPSLDTVVSVQLLPMLSHPDDPIELNGRQSGTLATYNFDFTPWKDRLQINYDSTYRRWLNFADVQVVGGYAGMSYWYNNRVVDMPTSAVPTANQSFERVMIQQNAGGGVVGPLYFHYDVNW